MRYDPREKQKKSAMATFRIPGVLCRVLGALEIDSGTLCRATSPRPGPVATARATTPIRIYSEHRGAVPKPLEYVGKDVYLRESDGSAQCAELVKRTAHAPNTAPDNWQRGTNLTPDNVGTIEIGTPIATGWDARGFYPHNPTGQHSGLFAGPEVTPEGDVAGFWIVEQYSSLSTIIRRLVYFDPVAHQKKDTYFYRGKDYATIKW